MSDWKTKTLGEVTSYIAKGIPPKYVEEVNDDTICVLNQKCNRNFRISYADSRLHNNAAKKVPDVKMLKPGDVLINSTGTGTAGRVAQIWDIEAPTTIDGHMILMRPTDEIDPLYYGYAVKAFQATIESYAEGSTGQTEINKTRLQNETIIMYPVDKGEQYKIARILAAIDEKILLNEEVNKNLEQQAQAIFKSWFIDLEPFNGAMPSDWEIVPLEKIVSFQNGYTFKSKELLNEPSSDCYQVFKQGHIARGGGFISDGTKSWFPKSLTSKLERFVLKKGDVLMAMTDMKDNVAILGNTAVMPQDNEYIVNQRVGHLRANGYKGITYPFVYLLTNSTDFLVDLRSRANSGVQVNLSSTEIKASQTVLPTEKVNTAFSEITLPMFETIINNQLENQKLTQLRDTILPKLMSGELDVTDIDL
jgi:Restriction endonuclease S subunits